MPARRRPPANLGHAAHAPAHAGCSADQLGWRRWTCALWIGLLLGLAAPLAGRAESGPAVGARPSVDPPTAAQGSAGPAGEPTLPYEAAVAARFPAPPVVYETPGLGPGRTSFTHNDELVAMLRAIAVRSDAVALEPGRSVTGEPLVALHFSRGPGRPAALLIGQQHGNEPAGAEALLVVAERLANPADPLAAVLDRIDVIVLPRANPDGAALDRRRNAAGLDVNRDHLRLATPEARAIGALMQAFRPVLVADLHEYQALGGYVARVGAFKRHDLLLQFPGTANLPPALAAASEAWFRRPLADALLEQGITSDWYHVVPAAGSGAVLFSMGGLSAALARNAGGLRHAVTLLLESRGYDLGRAHLQRRVHTHVLAVDHLLRAAATRADALRRLRDDADLAVAARACSGEIVIEAAMVPGRRWVTMLDPLTGADTAVDVAWASALDPLPRRVRSRPCAYWLAADQTNAVARLRALGVTVQTLELPAAAAGERYRVTAQGQVADPEGEGVLRRVAVVLEPLALAMPAGSHVVPLAQPLAHLAVAALEPDTLDSYHATGLVTRVDAVARIIEPR